MKIAWHYTTGQKAIQILESAELRPTDNYIEQKEKPILWFSTNQHWELSANKMLLLPNGSLRGLSMEEMGGYGCGLFRFGIPFDKVLRWPNLARMAGMKSKVKRALEDAGQKMGADFGEWCGLLKPVSIFELYGQVMTSKGWADINELGGGE